MRLFVCFLSLTISSSVMATELNGRCVGVTDGDTLTILDDAQQQYEVRLADVDSPETSCHTRKPSAFDEKCVEHGQPFGKTAKKSLSDLIFNKRVRVMIAEAKNKVGYVQESLSYGRVIGTVLVDGVDANLQQVARGYAWHYGQYARHDQTPQQFQLYQRAEDAAKRQGLGLWSETAPVAPWTYRHPGK